MVFNRKRQPSTEEACCTHPVIELYNNSRCQLLHIQRERSMSTTSEHLSPIGSPPAHHRTSFTFNRQQSNATSTAQHSPISPGWSARSDPSGGMTDPENSPPTDKKMSTFLSAMTKPDYSGKMVIIGNSGVGKSSLLAEYMRYRAACHKQSQQRSTIDLRVRPSTSSSTEDVTAGNVALRHSGSTTALAVQQQHSPDAPTATVGVAIHNVEVRIPGKVPTTVAFNVWDTAGQERFLALSPMYYRNAEAAMIVYDVTSRDSFLAVQKWVENLHSITGHLDRNQSSIKSLILVGNKADNQVYEPGKPASSDPYTPNRVVPFSDGARLAADLGAQFFETSVYRTDSIHDVWQMCAQEFAVRSATDKNILNTSANSNSSSNEDDVEKLYSFAAAFKLDAKRHSMQERDWKVLLNKCCT